MSRASLGAIIGIALAIVWQWLGWPAVLWSVLFGLIGFGVGWVIEHPEDLIGLLRRLER